MQGKARPLNSTDTIVTQHRWSHTRTRCSNCSAMVTCGQNKVRNTSCDPSPTRCQHEPRLSPLQPYLQLQLFTKPTCSSIASTRSICVHPVRKAIRIRHSARSTLPTLSTTLPKWPFSTTHALGKRWQMRKTTQIDTCQDNSIRHGRRH